MYCSDVRANVGFGATELKTQVQEWTEAETSPDVEPSNVPSTGAFQWPYKLQNIWNILCKWTSSGRGRNRTKHYVQSSPIRHIRARTSTLIISNVNDVCVWPWANGCCDANFGVYPCRSGALCRAQVQSLTAACVCKVTAFRMINYLELTMEVYFWRSINRRKRRCVPQCVRDFSGPNINARYSLWWFYSSLESGEFTFQ